MKKRLRRKLGRGEFAHPYPRTKAVMAANAAMRHKLAGLLQTLGPDEFFRRVLSANESIIPAP